MANYQIIDADGHVRESITGMREFLEPRWQRRNLFPNDAWDRDLRGKLGAKPEGPEDQLAAMDQDGIDVMVLYPTAGLHVGALHEPDFATSITRAYNDWLYHFCKGNPARLKFVALLAPQDPKAAADELERAVTQRGAVGGVLPTYLPQSPDFGDSRYDPLYAAAERLGVGLGFHTGTSADSLGGLRFRKFLSAHTIDHPAEQMMALIATIIGGVFERFPTLKIAYFVLGLVEALGEWCSLVIHGFFSSIRVEASEQELRRWRHSGDMTFSSRSARYWQAPVLRWTPSG